MELQLEIKTVEMWSGSSDNEFEPIYLKGERMRKILIVLVANLFVLNFANAQVEIEKIEPEAFQKLTDTQKSLYISALQTFLATVEREMPLLKEPVAVNSPLDFLKASFINEAFAAKECPVLATNTCVIAGNLSEMRPIYKKVNDEQECVGRYCSKANVPKCSRPGLPKGIQCNELLFRGGDGEPICISETEAEPTKLCKTINDSYPDVNAKYLKEFLQNPANKKKHDEMIKKIQDYCKAPQWYDKKGVKGAACESLSEQIKMIDIDKRLNSYNEFSEQGKEKTLCIYRNGSTTQKITAKRVLNDSQNPRELTNEFTDIKFYAASNSNNLTTWKYSDYYTNKYSRTGKANNDKLIVEDGSRKFRIDTKNIPSTCEYSYDGGQNWTKYPSPDFKPFEGRVNEQAFLGHLDKINSSYFTDSKNAYMKNIALALAEISSQKGCPGIKFVTGGNGSLPNLVTAKEPKFDITFESEQRFGKNVAGNVTCKTDKSDENWKNLPAHRIAECLVIDVPNGQGGVKTVALKDAVKSTLCSPSNITNPAPSRGTAN